MENCKCTVELKEAYKLCEEEPKVYEAYYKVTEAMRMMLDGGCSKEQLETGREEWTGMFEWFVNACVQNAPTNDEQTHNKKKFEILMDELGVDLSLGKK